MSLHSVSLVPPLLPYPATSLVYKLLSLHRIVFLAQQCNPCAGRVSIGIDIHLNLCSVAASRPDLPLAPPISLVAPPPLLLLVPWPACLAPPSPLLLPPPFGHGGSCLAPSSPYPTFCLIYSFSFSCCPSPFKNVIILLNQLCFYPSFFGSSSPPSPPSPLSHHRLLHL